MSYSRIFLMMGLKRLLGINQYEGKAYLTIYEGARLIATYGYSKRDALKQMQRLASDPKTIGQETRDNSIMYNRESLVSYLESHSYNGNSRKAWILEESRKVAERLKAARDTPESTPE